MDDRWICDGLSGSDYSACHGGVIGGYIVLGIAVFLFLYGINSELGRRRLAREMMREQRRDRRRMARARFFRRLVAPVNLLFRYRLWMMRSFEYRQAQLMRASHGAASALFAAVIGWHVLQSGILRYPVLLYPALFVLAVPVVWGALVFFDAARQSRGDFDWYLAPRALLKATVGGVGLLLLPGLWVIGSVNVLAVLNGDVAPLGQAVGYTLAWPIAFWCFVTGVTKFLLLLRGWERRKAPEAPENPHGQSRVANAEESKDAFARLGRRSQMDGVKF